MPSIRCLAAVALTAIHAAAAAAAGAASGYVQPITERQIDRLDEVAHLLNREHAARQMPPPPSTGGFIATTGAPAPLVPRVEIRDLMINNPDAFNMFVLGMRSFLDMDKNDPLSYYSIAGIHGEPYKGWNQSPQRNWGGMCPHSNVVFLSWHRPYLAMFEQALLLNVQKAVASFPPDQMPRWSAAAAGVRLPYIDWAAAPSNVGDPVIPPVVRSPQINVTTARGIQLIDNPLFSYKWGQWPQEMGNGPFNNYPETLRCAPGPSTPVSNNDDWENAMMSNHLSLRDRMYNLFIGPQSFVSASTEALVPGSDAANPHDSFEAVHDVVHTITGGTYEGHMWNLDYSAFDPFFWMHHCMIDRVFAMYQPLKGDYIGSGAANNNMWQWNSGDMLNADSPLIPFTKDTSGNYFTSRDVANTAVFNYIYPETSGSVDNLRNDINILYGPNAPRRKRDSVGNSTGQYPGRPFEEGDNIFLLTIHADKYLYSGSYTVHAFFGNLTSDKPADWINSPNYCGAHGILGMSMGNMTRNGTNMVEGSIPLTRVLQGKQASGELKTMSVEEVSRYLTTNLNYYVVIPTPNGPKTVSADKVPNMHFSVKTCSVAPAASPKEFPQWKGTMQTLTNVTANKPAGQPYTPPSSLSAPSWSNSSSSPLGLPGSYGGGAGKCSVHETIEYVDESGKFLYSVTSQL